MSRAHRWSSGSGRIELRIADSDAASMSHSGPCDADVRAASQKLYLAKQLAALDPEILAAELRKYGAWDADELADHEQNLQRVLWIAANDIADGPSAA